ncbi:MAG TPA: CbtB-domain containing protein [Actinomycetota bacterium]
MASPTSAAAAIPGPSASPSPSRPLGVPVPWWAWVAVGLVALLVFAIGYDQGQLLEPALGKAAASGNYLHEFFHDARHLLGFPCH